MKLHQYSQFDVSVNLDGTINLSQKHDHPPAFNNSGNLPVVVTRAFAVLEMMEPFVVSHN